MPPLAFSDAEVQQLQSIARSRFLPHLIVKPAQTWPVQGETVPALAERSGLLAADGFWPES